MTHLSKALASVAAERTRQIEKENWSPQHDDLHDRGELAAAAAVYALSAVMGFLPKTVTAYLTFGRGRLSGTNPLTKDGI